MVEHFESLDKFCSLHQARSLHLQSLFQDDSNHIAEADQVPGNGQQFTSHMNVDTHLSGKEVSTNAPVKNEAVREELTDTNTKSH